MFLRFDRATFATAQALYRCTRKKKEETVKKTALLVLLLFSLLALAGAEPKPADYTINVHVAASRMVLEGHAIAFSQRLDVTVDGKKYELRSSNVNALLAPGDYKAKLVKDQHLTPYDSYQVYEFLFSDNKTRKFTVIGVTE
jgi:hypothetical protein